MHQLCQWGRYGGEVGETQPDEELGPESDPLVECIRNGIYTAVGLGLLAINRLQAARQDATGQMSDDLRDAFSDLADQIPEDVRYAMTEIAHQLPDSARTVLADIVEQAPAIAVALREYLDRPES